jgi:hypothetical protein
VAGDCDDRAATFDAAYGEVGSSDDRRCARSSGPQISLDDADDSAMRSELGRLEDVQVPDVVGEDLSGAVTNGHPRVGRQVKDDVDASRRVDHGAWRGEVAGDHRMELGTSGASPPWLTPSDAREV